MKGTDVTGTEGEHNGNEKVELGYKIADKELTRSYDYCLLKEKKGAS